MRASDLETDANLDVPVEVGVALKALDAGTASAAQQQVALAFVIRKLCATDAMSFVVCDDIPLVMAWREGRRFVGIQLRRIISTPMPEPREPAAPPSNIGPTVRRSRSVRRARGDV